MEPGERRRKADEMLEMVGLAGMGERLPAELSGGQQQRVALARSLSFEPHALLLDEPLSALDAATRVAMRDEIRRIQKLRDTAALLITHDQDEALSLADRIAVLRDGRLVQYADPHAVYDRPADAFVASFVGRANLIEGRAFDAGAVDCAFGRLRTGPHGRPAGAALRLLVRPERIEPAAGPGPAPGSSPGAGPAGEGGAENVFAVRVLHDRFFGATRQLELAAAAAAPGGAESVLKMETTGRAPVTHVRSPRDAIQFLSH